MWDISNPYVARGHVRINLEGTLSHKGPELSRWENFESLYADLCILEHFECNKAFYVHITLV